MRARLASGQREHWRSLEELAEDDDFLQFLQREFPPLASEWTDAVSRRRFLKLMAASIALAGGQGCARQPHEKIVPYVRMPEQIVPGKPLHFATAMSLGGFATGLLAESHMGRPTKVEGNPDHPASLGATDALAQASVLTLYDPDRSQVITNVGQIRTWDAFLSALTPTLGSLETKQGEGLRVLTETVTSPTLAHQLRDLLERYPAAKWHQYEAVGRDNARAGARLAFGEPLNALYRFDRADAILSLDADFLAWDPGRLRYARDCLARRQAHGMPAEQAEMTRLYVVESTPSITGSVADHCLPLRPSQVEALAGAVAQRLGVAVESGPTADLPNVPNDWFGAVVDDLQHYRLRDEPGHSLVLAGESQPPLVHALAHAMNDLLGNVGHSVIYTDPVEASPVDQMQSLRDLIRDMEDGRVELLVILGGNPVFDAPVDLRFAQAVRSAKLRVRLGLYEDETSDLCHWHVPETHYLESWSDTRAYDGTVTIAQPLIAPLYSGKSPHELLGALLGEPGRSAHDLVRDYWMQQHGSDGFDGFWQTALHDGFIRGTGLPARDVPVRQNFLTQERVPSPRRADARRSPAESATAGEGNLEIVFRPDPTIWDGRFANNGWLQELPKPLTKLTWDNAALLSPATAERLGVDNEQVVQLQYRGRTLDAPAWIMPGHPDDTVTLHLGYGRSRAGRVGDGVGVNAYAIRTADAPWFGTGLEVRGTTDRYPLASTQHHHSMEGRSLIRHATLAAYQEDPRFAHPDHPAEHASMFPEHQYDGYKWGMAIDLSSCIGCNACVAACQAENNIPIVGKSEVATGREMHWLRIDRYYAGGLDNPSTYHQPVPCMHCEKAPCEVVCPVAATVHSDEGLNDMIYNRCVGTRYCSNNCPYKVRRFNFLQYADSETPVLKLLRNPDVTVRTRGVMEKCTYCVQRINAARIEAEKQDRPIRDGEVVTACQGACPTRAIVFGDLNDPESRVKKLKDEPLNYALLEELNTRPRTTYLAALGNPNPAIAGSRSR